MRSMEEYNHAATIYGQGQNGFDAGGTCGKKSETELCGNRTHFVWSAARKYGSRCYRPDGERCGIATVEGLDKRLDCAGKHGYAGRKRRLFPQGGKSAGRGAQTGRALSQR